MILPSHGGADAPRRAGQRADGRRGRQGGDRAPGGGAGGRADVAGDRAAVARRRRAEGRRARHGADCRHPGGQAHAELIPLCHSLPLSCAGVSWRSRTTAGTVTPTAEARRTRRPGSRWRRRRRPGRGADPLRHAQGDREGRRDRAGRAAGEERRAPAALWPRGQQSRARGGRHLSRACPRSEGMNFTKTLPLIAAAAALALPAAASADTLVAPAPGAQNLASGGGYLAWSAPASGRRLPARPPRARRHRLGPRVPKSASRARPGHRLGPASPRRTGRCSSCSTARDGDIYQLRPARRAPSSEGARRVVRGVQGGLAGHRLRARDVRPRRRRRTTASSTATKGRPRKVSSASPERARLQRLAGRVPDRPTRSSSAASPARAARRRCRAAEQAVRPGPHALLGDVPHRAAAARGSRRGSAARAGVRPRRHRARGAASSCRRRRTASPTAARSSATTPTTRASSG